MRSARFAAFGSVSVTRSRCGGRPGVRSASARSTAVPGSVAVRPCASAGIRSVESSFAMSVGFLVRLRGQPDGERDDRAEAEDPEEEALGDRAEAAEREAADVLAPALRLQRRDDVLLLLRRD